MTRDDVQRIMDEVPGLNATGIGAFEPKKLTAEEREQQIAAGQRYLFDNIDECTQCCEWLQQIEKIQTINSRHSSYGLKQFAEDYTGSDISHGAFIVAAIHCGFRFQRIPDTISVMFAMSEKSVKAAEQRGRERMRIRHGF